MDKRKWIIVVAFIGLVALEASFRMANARGLASLPTTGRVAMTCQCQADISSKKYLDERKGWFRVYKKWTCDYGCVRRDGATDMVTGTLERTVMREEGDEFVCEGLVYHMRYNPATNDEQFFLEEINPFDPSQARSPELREWAARECGDTK